jgi:hypothetical protein
MIKALRRKDYGVSAYFAIATVEPSKDLSDTGVKNAIRVVGERDWIAGLFFGNRRYRGVDKQYHIVLKGIGHTQYGYDPNDPNPDPMAVMAARLIGLLMKNHNDDDWLDNVLKRYKRSDGSYYVDLEDFARRYGL